MEGGNSCASSSVFDGFGKRLQDWEKRHPVGSQIDAPPSPSRLNGVIKKQGSRAESDDNCAPADRCVCRESLLSRSNIAIAAALETDVSRL